MGRIACVTTFSREGWQTYGMRMVATFNNFWPGDIDLHVYYEGSEPFSYHWHPLDADKDRAEFMRRHQDHPTDYRQQPVKFSHKVFAVTAAPRDTDWLIWLDGDLQMTAPVTHEFLGMILPDDVVACYLGRPWWNHTETGFVAYRLDDIGRKLLDDMRVYYTSDKVMTLPEKHDCAVFDDLRRLYEGAGGHKFLNLVANYHGPDLNVMAHSPLAKVMLHNKGITAKRRAYGSAA